MTTWLKLVLAFAVVAGSSASLPCKCGCRTDAPRNVTSGCPLCAARSTTCPMPERKCRCGKCLETAATLSQKAMMFDAERPSWLVAEDLAMLLTLNRAAAGCETLSVGKNSRARPRIPSSRMLLISLGHLAI